MFGIGFAVVALSAAVVAGAVVAGIALIRGSLPPSGAEQVTVVREWRLVLLTRWCGIALGVVAAVTVARTGPGGTGLMLAPAAFGLVVLAATAIGETVVRPRRPPGARSADLTTRRIRDHLPRPFASLIATLFALEVVTLVFTTTTASPDETSGELRALACSAPGVGAATSPYPGSFYALPLAVALVVAVAVAGVAAVQVVRRPRGMATTGSGDDGLRRRSLGVVVAALGVAVCGPLTGVSVVAGFALARLSDACAPTWMRPVGASLVGLALVAGVVTVVCLGRILVGTAHGVGTSRRQVAGTAVR